MNQRPIRNDDPAQSWGQQQGHGGKGTTALVPLPAHPSIGERSQVGAHREQGRPNFGSHLSEGCLNQIPLRRIRKRDIETMHKQQMIQLMAKALEGAEGIKPTGEKGAPRT